MSRKPALIALVAALVLVSLACSLAGKVISPTIPATSLPELPTPGISEPVESPSAPTESLSEPTQPAAATPAPVDLDLRGPVFASYNYSAPQMPTSFPPSYSLPVDLGQVKGMDLAQLSADQQALLSQNGFVVVPPVPGKYQEFYQLYESQRYNEIPVFATTDALFHTYHLVFDKMLRDLERDAFIPALEKLTTTMLNTSVSQYESLKGTPLEEPARRNVAFFAVAAHLLGLSEVIPSEVEELVQSELALIEAHSSPEISPIWDREDLAPEMKLIEDYSQYIPRGHYTRSEVLQRYFKAMMWYGRLSFRVRDDFETQRALLVTQALRTAQTADGIPALQLWQNIYDPTAFIVGKTDDLSVYEYGNLSDQIFGAGADLQAFSDPDRVAAFRDLARQLPPPQVNSMWVWIWEDKTEATQAFRFMGQRFTLDEYVFGQLIWRNVGTLDQPRGLPKGLDFLASMGSDTAYDVLKAMGESAYQNYDQQMEKVRQEISALELDSWTQNLYWSWLYAFQPLIEVKDQRFPPFMNSSAWQLKDLQTSLGSWTELKHDTLLYAKQVMAEMGGGGPEEPPHGYIEPNPEVYARLLALTEMTRDGLEERGLLSETTRANLENLAALLTFSKSVSERELAGQPLTDEEYWQIQYFGGALEALTLASSDCAEGDPMMCHDLSDQKAAVVADVATGINPDGSLVVLEEGVGQPTEIYVVLPDEPYRLAVGGVYSYYEFEVPPDSRMTDEQWQEMVETGSQPPQPPWVSSFSTP